MDEADKYKQRLEAIAEKRQLQEEQDKARRKMEEEKLRLQQLKRKSLRDQWLMEGAPLSPLSPDLQSPLWSTKAQEMESMERLQSESQRLAEEEEKLLKEHRENAKTEAVKVGEAGVETTGDGVKTNQSAPLNETAAVQKNAREKADFSPEFSDSNQSASNGCLIASEGVSMNLTEGTRIDISEGEPVLSPNVGEELEEEPVVNRAECVIITDEGDDDQFTYMESKQPPLPNPESDHGGQEVAEEELNTEVASEMFKQPEKGEIPKHTAEAPPATAAEGKKLTDPTSMQVQPPFIALEGGTVSYLPVYCQSALSPELQAECEDTASLEGAEITLKDQEPATLPVHFQEVPLEDPQKNHETEGEPEEQEPLLSQSTSPDSHTEPAVANTSASPIKAPQGETQTPKEKTCQCCSVM